MRDKRFDIEKLEENYHCLMCLFSFYIVVKVSHRLVMLKDASLYRRITS